jgi:hypothetical protein
MSEAHKRMIGSTLIPLNTVIYRDSDPLDLSAYTVKFQMEGETTGTVKVAESTTGVTAHPTQTFTAAIATNLLTCAAHGVKAGDQIVVSSATTLPAGLAAATRYFAVDVGPNDFALATRPSGPAVDITTTGTGAHSFYIVGSVQKVFLAADVDTAGRYSAWWTVVSGSDFAAAPVERQGLVVEVIAFGN